MTVSSFLDTSWEPTRRLSPRHSSPKATRSSNSFSQLLSSLCISSHMPGSPSADVQIDFLRGTSSLQADIVNVDKAAHAPNSRQDYVLRRFELFDASDDAPGEVELGAISRLPLTLQVAFRWKMLSIFALQLLVVWALVGVCAYVPQVNDLVHKQFQGQIEYLTGALVGVVVLLAVLYLIRSIFPLNWLVLVTFSVAQALLFAILGIKFDTNLGFFNCGASFSCIVIMILLSGVRRRKSGEEAKLLSPIAAGFIAYVVVALASCGLFVKYGREFITAEGFGASLGFQFVLIMWFAIDASSMYRVMSPDEYMHGVIYFYTDMILLVVMCAVAVGIGALVALCSGDGCSGDCPSCNGGCCTGTDCSNACSCSSSRQSQLETATDSGCAWGDCFYWCCGPWMELCCDLMACNWNGCNDCCRGNDKSQKPQQQQPLNDTPVEYPAGSALYIPPWEELQKKSVADESVSDLEMQRV